MVATRLWRLVPAGALLALLAGALAQPGAGRQATFPGASGRLAYDVGNDIWTVNADGSGRLNVTRGRFGSAEAPAWSPDGARIAFANADGIWVIGADGSGPKQVTHDPNFQDTDPAWSPDDRRLVFAHSEDGTKRLYVVNLDGSGLRAVTPAMSAGAEDPDWSPDGGTIAFDDGNDVWAIGADGSGLRQLTGYGSPANAPSGISPSWSPDGSRLAYKGCVDVGSCSIYTVAPDGSAPAMLTSGLYEPWELAWSPDGSRIALVDDANTPAQEQLFVIDADGSGLRQLGVQSHTTLDWGRACVVVPDVRGKTLAGAESAIKRTIALLLPAESVSFSLAVEKVRAARVKKGRVVSQKPKPGMCLALAPGGKVTLSFSWGATH